MTRLVQRSVTVLLVATYVAIPALLFWFGASRCEELGCVGPILQAFIHALTIVPLLITWAVGRRLRYAVMLAVVEVAFSVAMFVSAREDFVAWPALVAVPLGLNAGAFLGIGLERLWRWSGEPSRG